jgi:hypothetical protein
MTERDRERAIGRVVADVREGERRSGLRPLGETASRIAAPIVMRGGGGMLTRLKAEWSAVAGNDVAMRTWPEKLGRDGALKLRVAPGMALDLQHRAPQVIDRINSYFGRAAVKRLVLVQGLVPSAGPEVPAHSASPTGGDGGMLDSRLAGIDDSDLRSALAGLADLVLRASRRAG